MKKFILLPISIFFAATIFSSCSPHTSPAKHKRYHNYKTHQGNGPDFPGVGNLGPAECPKW